MSNTADLQGQSVPFLPSDQISEMLEQAIYMARFSDLLLLVSGESGSGRTSFAREITRRAADLDVLELDAQRLESLEHLQTTICQKIGLAEMQLPGDALIPVLVDQLSEQQNRAAYLLIIDNADRLDLEVLTWLVNLQKKARQQKLRLPILFTAEPSFEHRMVLLEDQVASGQQYTFHLHPMDREEAASWLNHPLLLRALHREPLGSEQIDSLWQQSDGFPGKMLQLVKAEMLELPKAKSSKSGVVFIAAGLLVASVGGAWWMHGGADGLFAKEQLPDWAAGSDAAPVEAVAPEAPQPEPQIAQPSISSEPEVQSTIIETAEEAAEKPQMVDSQRQPVEQAEPAEAVAVADHQQAQQLVAQTRQVAAEVAPVEAVQETVSEAEVAAQAEPAKPVEPVVAKAETSPSPAISEPKSALPVVEVQGNQLVETEQSEQEIIPELEAPATEQPEEPALELVDSAEKAAPQEAAKTVAAKPVKTEPVAKPVAKPVVVKVEPKSEPAVEVEAELSEVVAKAEPVKTAPTRWAVQEAAIKARSNKNWTMQILAASKEQILQKAIDEYGLGDDISYYRVLRKGKVWYVMIFGNFDSKQAAMDAVSGLPREVRRSKPWIRRYSAVHKALGQVDVNQQ